MFVKLVKLWLHNKPDIVIGFGGFFTVTPVVVAKLFGAKIVIYEQNSLVGKSNRLLAKIADLKLSTFPIDDSWQRIPAPVRQEFIKNHDIPYHWDDMEKMKIVVIGGSQGAISFSHIIPNAIHLLPEQSRSTIEIIQQIGSIGVQQLKNHLNRNTFFEIAITNCFSSKKSPSCKDILEIIYSLLGIKAKISKFIYNISEEMADAQLIICRSGASTLSELSILGRPAILIPYPNSADNHQWHNAIYYGNRNAAWVLEEDGKIENNIAQLISKAMGNRELLKHMASNMIDKSACNAIADFIEIIERVNERA
jgi:UDP-N-acetylglucosamine--N-acetylmuramyl-(pentapeptide) pyrophosphoryl-undecaprenol N-acetylglucosamine transferase